MTLRISSDPKQEAALLPLFSSYFLDHAFKMSNEAGGGGLQLKGTQQVLIYVIILIYLQETKRRTRNLCWLLVWWVV